MESTASAKVRPAASRRQTRLLPRFSLRWLMIAVTLVAIWVAWLAASTKQQQTARKELAALGATTYLSGNEPLASPSDTLMAKLRAKVADHFDENLVLSVTSVQTPYLEEPSLRRGAAYSPREVVDILPRLPRLESAHLTHTEINNSDLKSLRSLKQLKHLDLQMTRIHEGPLDELRGMKLKTLCLDRTRADDESLESIANMDSLEFINLTRTKVTGEGLRSLESLPNLKTLLIRRCLVTEQEYLDFKKRRPDVTVKWQRLERP